MKKLVIVGDPIERSMSPTMWSVAFKALGLEREYTYKPLKVEREKLGEFVNRLRGGEIIGANVTMPYKIAIMEHLDRLTNNAALIGAVNTLYAEKGNIIGENTDGIGCLCALRDIDVRGKKVLVLGAGGAARAVSFTLALEGIDKLIILNRTRSKGKKLAEEITQKLSTNVLAEELSAVKRVIKEADIIINCTPAGMIGEQDETCITDEMLKPEQVVMDVVYNPPETRLLKEAKKAGATTISGIDVLVYQAAINFERWIGKDAPIATMKQAVVKELSESS